MSIRYTIYVPIDVVYNNSSSMFMIYISTRLFGILPVCMHISSCICSYFISSMPYLGESNNTSPPSTATATSLPWTAKLPISPTSSGNVPRLNTDCNNILSSLLFFSLAWWSLLLPPPATCCPSWNIDIAWLPSPPDRMNDDSSTADEEDTALLRKVGRWIRFNLRLPLPGTCPWYDARGEEVFRKSHSLIISSRPAVFVWCIYN